MSNQKITQVVALHPEVYKKLEAKLSRTVVTDSTSPIAVGFALGIEAALKELRNGLVMEIPNAAS